MLNAYAWHFFILSRLLEGIHQRLGIALPPRFTGTGLLGSFGALGGTFPSGQNNALALALQPPPSPALIAPDGLTDNERSELLNVLEILDSVCTQIGIIKISKDIDRARTDANATFTDRKRIQFHVETLTNRVIDELYDTKFLHVLDSKIKYYLKPDLFGSEVGGKFPKVGEDITNAGTAYALGLSTASVFHLMRVMEHCVQRLGKRLKVPINVQKESWGQIMDHVNAAIKCMRGGKNATAAQNRRKENYALAAGRLDHVRLVWRNDTMHPKSTYDEIQALEILTSVEAFLRSVVELV